MLKMRQTKSKRFPESNYDFFSISVRLAALRLLNLAFTANYVPEFVSKYKFTLLDLVSKNLKKTDEECVVSALLLANMSLQICKFPIIFFN